VVQVNKQFIFSSQAIASGDYDIGIGCGVEMMGVVQMGSDSLPECFTLDENKEQKFSFGDFPFKLLHQGVSAELIAKKYNITRDEMEQFAVDSHRKASIAIKEGRFKSQIIPITVTDKEGNTNTVTIDEGVKYPVDITKMKALKSPFKKRWCYYCCFKFTS